MSLVAKLALLLAVSILAVMAGAFALLETISPVEVFEQVARARANSVLLEINQHGRVFLAEQENDGRLTKKQEAKLLPLIAQKSFASVTDLGQDDLSDSLCALSFIGDTNRKPADAGETEMRVCYYVVSPNGGAPADERLHIIFEARDENIVLHTIGQQPSGLAVDTYILQFKFMLLDGTYEHRYFRATHQVMRDAEERAGTTRYTLTLYRASDLSPASRISGPAVKGLNGSAIKTASNKTVAILTFSARELCRAGVVRQKADNSFCPTDLRKVELRAGRTKLQDSNLNDRAATTYTIELKDIVDKVGRRVTTVDEVVGNRLMRLADASTLRVDQTEFSRNSVYLPDPDLLRDVLAPFASGTQWVYSNLHESSKKDIREERRLSGSDRVLAVEIPFTQGKVVDASLYQLGFIGLLSSFLISVILILGGWSYYLLVRPIQELQRSLRSVLTNNAPVESALKSVSRKDEIGSLSAVFRDLILHIQASVVNQEGFNSSQHRLLSAIGHEIRSPLMALWATISNEDSGGRRYIERMKRALETLTDVQSVQEGIRKRTTSARTADLAKFVSQVCENVSSIEIQNVEFDGPNNVSAVFDDSAFEDVLVNILKNADRHRVGASAIEVSLATSTLEATISIHNKGPIISNDVLPKIFDYGVTTGGSNENLGLGLFIGQTYMSLMGGSISVRNEADGVTFVLSLPLGGGAVAGVL